MYMRANEYGITSFYYWWTGQRWIGPWQVAVGGYEYGMPRAVNFWRVLKDDITYRGVVGYDD